jgi:hypothetical protein
MALATDGVRDDAGAAYLTFLHRKRRILFRNVK